MTSQLALLPDVPTSIDSGIEYLLIRARRGKRQYRWHCENMALAIKYSFAWNIRSKGTRRPAKYPFEMVEYARKLRGFGFFYREIADEIRSKFRVTVPWITIRDWTNLYYRCSK